MSDSSKLYSLPQVSRMTGLSADEIRRAVSAGRFPQPIPLGPWDFAWTAQKIESWLKAPNTTT